MILTRSVLREERGSFLLISLVSITIMTILGLALFELGQIEGQQSGASLGDARAFEVAQAGLERAIRELQNAILADEAAPNGHGSESWVDGPNRPTCTPACETAVYQPMNLANATLLPRPVAANPLVDGQDPGGTFTVELKQVLVAEANNPVSQGGGYTYPYGQQCIPSAPTNPTVCANLMFVRSTGTVLTPGYTATRTVQALVKAYSTSYFAGGLTAEKGGGNDPAIDGRVLIAGSVHILGSSNINPAFQIDGGAAMGMRNSWFDLWPDTDLGGVLGDRTLYRITPRQLICPTGATCTGGANLVESLGAELKIFGNLSNIMANLRNNTNLGINTIQTASSYGDATVGSRYGKGFMDGVYVADGCPMPCTSQSFTFGGSSTIHVDTNNYTKPYPYRPPKLPLKYQLSTITNYPDAWNDDVVINGTYYTDWEGAFFIDHTLGNALLAGAPATQPGTAVLTNGSLNSVNANGGYCGPTYQTGNFGAVLRSGSGLQPDATFGNPGGGFCHTFKFLNKAGAVRVGEICWRRNVLAPSADATNLPPNYTTVPTLEFGIPSCSAPNDPLNPLLIYHRDDWRLGYTSGVDYQYRGSAIIYLRNNDIFIENTLQTACSTPAVTPPCVGERFPENNLLILLNAHNGHNANIANDNSTRPVRRFMGYVYTESAIQSQYATNLVGSLRAQQLCFNNSSSTNGCSGVGSSGGNPKFFQVSFPDLRKIPAELPASSGNSGNPWVVDLVPRFWMECRRGPGDTLPTTPTGTCQYQ